METLASKSLQAYGGEDLWRSAKMVRLVYSAWGWAFRLKWQRPFTRAEALIDPWGIEVSIKSREGVTGRFNAREVSLETADGRSLRSRSEPWKYFPYGRRALYWDELDQTWFSGYALWNYFTFPHLLIRTDVAWRAVGADRLAATFAPGVPSHCREQTFRIDPATGLLLQHDYTAEVFGGWARAAHMVLAHSVNAAGLTYTSARRVYPRRADGAPRPFPLLVGIDVHEYEAIS